MGPDTDYEPPNQTLALGNDDQAFWGIAALVAAERGFPDPPKDKPQWLALAQAVFNRQAGRWDTESCNGGLRWQVVASNKGYDYKNSVSNGLFFQMGSRLARYTGNQTYADLGEKAYNWCKEMGLLTYKYNVYDGAHIPECTVSSRLMWSYNAGIFLAGAAAMYDYYVRFIPPFYDPCCVALTCPQLALGNTEKAAFWQNETMNLLKATDQPFFNRQDGRPNVMRESGCESRAPKFDSAPTCNIDQISFKAFLCRFMGYTFQLAPFTRDFIMQRLRASAVAAAKSCSGQPGGDTCGLSWLMGKFDGSKYGIAIGGVGEHLAVMELFQNLLVGSVDTPRTHTTGTSRGDPAAGSSGSRLNKESLRQASPTTTRDRISAGILTAAFAVGPFVFAWWLIR